MIRKEGLRSIAGLSLASYCLLLFSPIDQWLGFPLSKVAWVFAIVLGYPFLISDKPLQKKSHISLVPQLAVASLILLPLLRFVVVSNDQSLWNYNWQTLLFVMLAMPLIFGLEDSAKRMCVSAVGAGLVLNCFALFHSYYSLGEISEISGRPLYLSGGRDVNFLATALCAAFPLLAFNVDYASQLRARLKSRTALSLFWLASTGILFGASIVLSESRTGALCFAATLLLMAMTASRSMRPMQWAFIVILVVSSFYAFTYGGLIERLVDVADQSSQERLKTYLAAYRSFADSPILGAGFGGAADNYYKFSGFGSFESLNPKLVPHNFIAQLGAEFGVFGLGILCVAFFAGLRLLRSMTDKHLLHNRKYIFISLFALIVSGLAMPIAYLDWAYMIVILCLALASPKFA